MFSALRFLKSEKGAIAPIVLMLLLAIGIVVSTKLVNLPQIFKSKATATSISREDCDKTRQSPGGRLALQDNPECLSHEGNFEKEVCTFAGWKSYQQMVAEVGRKPGAYRYEMCEIFTAFNNNHQSDVNSSSSGGNSGGSSGGSTPSLGGGSPPSEASLKACADAIRDKKVGRTESCSTGSENGACTYDGWKTWDDMASYMKQQGWTGNYGSRCDVFDAYLGQLTEKGLCVNRVQQEFRLPGDGASRDPLSLTKILGIGSSFKVKMVDNKKIRQINGWNLTMTGPDGSKTIPADALVTPNQVGEYKIVGSGGDSNEYRCDETSQVSIQNNCATSCGQCVWYNADATTKAQLTKDTGLEAVCGNYDKLVDAWARANPAGVNERKNDSRFNCVKACSADVNQANSIPANPDINGISVACSGSKATISWPEASTAFGYAIRLDNTTKGLWSSCDESKGDICRDQALWTSPNNPTSIEVSINGSDQYDGWIAAYNQRGNSINPAHFQFKCPEGITSRGGGPSGGGNPPSATLTQTVGGLPARVGQPVSLIANTTIGSGKSLKNATVWVAKRVGSGTSAYAGRVNRDSCSQGYNCQSDRVSGYDDRCSWCKIGSSNSSGQFSASWTPSSAGEYDFIISVEDSSFIVGDARSNGLCSSNPYVPSGVSAGYPYIDGYGRFSFCGSGSNLRLTVGPR